MIDKTNFFGDKIITRFDGTEFAFLSNFFLSAIPFVFVDGSVTTVNTVEHAYQAYKTKNLVEQTEIANAMSPGLAKKLGQRCTVDTHWEFQKIGVMFSCIMLKFTLHERLKHKLLATCDAELIEGNTWGDKFWGQVDGKGLNNLGKVLMQVRKIISIDTL